MDTRSAKQSLQVFEGVAVPRSTPHGRAIIGRHAV